MASSRESSPTRSGSSAPTVKVEWSPLRIPTRVSPTPLRPYSPTRLAVPTQPGLCPVLVECEGKGKGEATWPYSPDSPEYRVPTPPSPIYRVSSPHPFRARVDPLPPPSKPFLGSFFDELPSLTRGALPSLSEGAPTLDEKDEVQKSSTPGPKVSDFSSPPSEFELIVPELPTPVTSTPKSELGSDGVPSDDGAPADVPPHTAGIIGASPSMVL